ncbi:MAG: hypothetical protein ACRC46_02995 [Thermoguttaceae bacterium]
MEILCLFLQKRRFAILCCVILLVFGSVFAADVAPVSSATSAVSLLQRSAATILIHNTIRATLRLDVELAGDVQTAEGQYIEQRNDDPTSTMIGQTMFRLDLQFPLDASAPVGAEPNSMTVVCNARSISHYTAIEGVKRLERIVVKDLDKAIHESKVVSIPYTLSGLGGLGGLAGMVKQLIVYYDFSSPPETFVLEGKESFPVWKLTGTLKPAWQERLAAAQTLSPTAIPTEVEVILGRDELFPYRVHYFHRRDAKTTVTVARLIFAELVFGGEPAPLFKFETFDRTLPHGIILEDVTDSYIKALTQGQ